MRRVIWWRISLNTCLNLSVQYWNLGNQIFTLLIRKNSLRSLIPTASNANEILQQLSHKTLVQEPAYVIEQWAKILSMAMHSLQEISEVYETLQPTVRKVLKSLTFPVVMNVHQKDIQKYLTAYLRNTDIQQLCLFLRFCTGSDLFLGKNIIVEFTKIPYMRLCAGAGSPLIYSNHPNFSSEMNKVLSSNVWVMDTI